MAVRNFYLKATIDGRKTPLSGGPGTKDGGMWLHVTRRNQGKIEDAISLECFVKTDGETLCINVFGPDGNTIWTGYSKR